MGEFNCLKNKDRSDLKNSINKKISDLNFDFSHHSILNSQNSLFLGRFSQNDFHEMIDRVGLLDHLARKGFKDILVKIEIEDNGLNHFRAYDQKETADRLLMNLKVSESRFQPENKFFRNESKPVTYEMIVIEWLSAHNPNQSYFENRPQLPGQTSPGLGVLKYYFALMYLVAKEVAKDGFLDIPDYVHGAIMYTKKFKFFDPIHEGVLQALLRDLKNYSLSDISWGILTKTIIETYKNQPQVYNPSEQIFYVSKKMRDYFHSKYYKNIFRKYYKRKNFRFDYQKMLAKREEILKNKKIADL